MLCPAPVPPPREVRNTVFDVVLPDPGPYSVVGDPLEPPPPPPPITTLIVPTGRII
jgi:hypothetical protein